MILSYYFTHITNLLYYIINYLHSFKVYKVSEELLYYSYIEKNCRKLLKIQLDYMAFHIRKEKESNLNGAYLHILL